MLIARIVALAVFVAVISGVVLLVRVFYKKAWREL